MPLVVTIVPSPNRGSRLTTAASSQPFPPTRLLEVWATTTADSRMAANWRQPRTRSSSGSTSLRSSRQRSQGARAVTRAACTDTPGGAMAHHSASGTASLPTMNRPMRARQPQLSLLTGDRPPRESLRRHQAVDPAPRRGQAGEKFERPFGGSQDAEDARHRLGLIVQQHDGERADRAMMVAPEPGGDRHHLVVAHRDVAVPAVVQLAIGKCAAALDGVEVLLGVGACDVTLGRHENELLP